ncbi:hypothetical protein SKAU_G00032900 [Synaphobranchus kaupii]|uniref:Uncharacterized protein n=1 Tax=Synaphobranchus kaupii TaxID=118154 RepID=A0A9Q1JG61_SYNKA|nr:hypothetical protein SKAU_G00032900 [Synaphobranchus kaupii]
MALLAPPIPGQPLLSLDKIVGGEPSYMTSILKGSVPDWQKWHPAELGREPWRMRAEPEEPTGTASSELGLATGPGDTELGKLPEHPCSSEPSCPKGPLYYCPLICPRGSRPAAQLIPLPVPLPLLPNFPVPYYPALALPLPSCPVQACPQGRYSGFSRWQNYPSVALQHPAPRLCSLKYCPVLPEECRTSDPREKSKFKEGLKVRHKATGGRTRIFGQPDSEGRRAGGWWRGGGGQAVADRALSEYSHIMESLGSEVTGRSEAMEEERGKFTEYLNQLCQQKEFVTQVLALIDMRCVWSLLAPDMDTRVTHKHAETVDGETHPP